MLVGQGKILDIFRVGDDLWIYSLWHDKTGHFEMGVSRRMHIQIIEIEGDIIGREIKFQVDEKEMFLIFLDDKEKNNADKTG